MIKRVYIDLFDFYFYISTDKESASRFLKKRHVDFDVAEIDTGVVIDAPEKEFPPLIAVFDEDILTAAHESLHASMIMLNDVGVPYGYENQEVLCYSQQCIYRKVLDCIRSSMSVEK